MLSALDNDLNTSVALSVIAELAKVGNEIVMQIQKQKKDPPAQAVVEARWPPRGRGARRVLRAARA